MKNKEKVVENKAAGKEKRPTQESAEVFLPLFSFFSCPFLFLPLVQDQAGLPRPGDPCAKRRP